MSTNRRALARTRPAREMVFAEWAAMAAEEIGDELIEYEVTDERLNRLVQRVRALGLPTTGNGRRDIRYWLEHAATQDPTIDELAVRRAVDFDWSVWPALTPTERFEVADRLAAMDDPYEEPGKDVAQRIMLDHAGTSWGWPSAAEPSPRRLRWLETTQEQRDVVMAAISRARAWAEAARAA